MVQLSFADAMIRDEQARMARISEAIYDEGDRNGGVDYEELDYYEERARWACEDIALAWFAAVLTS